TVRDTHLTRMDGPPHPDPATMVNGHPARTGCGIDESVEQWPVGNRVRPVRHILGLPVRRSHTAGIEMVPADHHRSLQLTPGDHLVELQSRQLSLPITEPTDTRRQSLKRH